MCTVNPVDTACQMDGTGFHSTMACLLIGFYTEELSIKGNLDRDAVEHSKNFIPNL